MLIVLFLVSHFNFLFVPYGRPRLSYLPVSFLLPVYNIQLASRNNQVSVYSERRYKAQNLIYRCTYLEMHGLRQRRRYRYSIYCDIDTVQCTSNSCCNFWHSTLFWL